jgi:hypothetical protein
MKNTAKGSSPKTLDFDQVINNADTIFHYTNSRTAMEHILFEKQLRFSKLAKTNDPHEYRDRDIVFWSDNLELNLADRLEIQPIVNRICKSEYKIACFCSNDHPNKNGSLPGKCYGYERLRMWSQYGENYYGVCIAFSRDTLLETLQSMSLKYTDNHVTYSDDLADISNTLSGIEVTQPIEEKNNDEFARDHVEKNLTGIFFTKHRDYQDEAEYRIIVQDQDNKFDILDISDCIKAVLVVNYYAF